MFFVIQDMHGYALDLMSEMGHVDRVLGRVETFGCLKGEVFTIP